MIAWLAGICAVPWGAALARGPDLVLRLLPSPGLLGSRGWLRPADRGRRRAHRAPSL